MPRIVQLAGTHEDWFGGANERVVPYHRMYGKQYCLPAFVCYERALVDELQQASETLDRIFWKAMRFVQRYLDEEVMVQQLGLSPALLQVAQMEVPHHGVARQDWIVNGHSLKLIEYNTDTPTGLPETAWLAEQLLRASGLKMLGNASSEMERLIGEAFLALVELYREAGYGGKLFFSCYGDHVEDRANTLYLLRLAEQAGIDCAFVPLSALRIVPGDGLFASEQRIEMLYRLYPLEYLPADRDAEGSPIGEALLELVAAGRLMLINPAQSVITQSKGMLALIWALYRRNEWMYKQSGLDKPLFDEAECTAIERWMLPADWSAEAFHVAEMQYVRKGFFGREGRGTEIVLERETLGTPSTPDVSASPDVSVPSEHVDDADRYYFSQPKVYQKYEPMLPLSVMTEEGMYQGYLLTGVFVVGRKFAGILPRIGERVTGDMAYFCAAVVDEAY
jgi:glutathionylspermidine synthase